MIIQCLSSEVRRYGLEVWATSLWTVKLFDVSVPLLVTGESPMDAALSHGDLFLDDQLVRTCLVQSAQGALRVHGLVSQ